MRSIEELERIAFREALTHDEDAVLAEHFVQRADKEPQQKAKVAALKQAAFFAARAFDKGARSPEQLARWSKVLTVAQKTAPSDSFRRKLNEVKAAMKGELGFEKPLKKLARKGEALDKSVLATDDKLDTIESSLGIKLPPSYRHYLKTYAHRQIGTFEPFTATELEQSVREAWDGGLEERFLPFLEDNADLYCFDLSSGASEPPVVFRPHDGTSKETWPSFVAWVEECWLGELDE